MTIYAIILNESDATAWGNVRETWPDHLIADDRLAFVSADNTVTSKISEAVGIGPDTARGIVIQMEFYAGHTSGTIVEWLAKRRD